jgi:hypothetical protein
MQSILLIISFNVLQVNMSSREVVGIGRVSNDASKKRWLHIPDLIFHHARSVEAVMRAMCVDAVGRGKQEQGRMTDTAAPSQRASPPLCPARYPPHL